MIFRCSQPRDEMSVAHQGSRAQKAQAEKVLLSVGIAGLAVQAGQPSNLAVLRLDGWNPHGYWLRQPPNLANRNAHTSMRTRARIRVRRVPALLLPFPRNLEIGWEGWEVGKPSIHAGFSRPTYCPTFSRLGEVIQSKGVEMSKGSLREQMPTVAAIIDEFRAAFGKESIDKVIRAGMKGQPVFFASENGHTIGTPIPPGAPGPDRTSPTALAAETHRERYYRQASARSKAVTTRPVGHIGEQL